VTGVLTVRSDVVDIVDVVEDDRVGGLTVLASTGIALASVIDTSDCVRATSLLVLPALLCILWREGVDGAAA